MTRISESGSSIKWIQKQGGWASAKMLLDVYGHRMPNEMSGYSANLAPELRNRPEQGSRSA